MPERIHGLQGRQPVLPVDQRLQINYLHEYMETVDATATIAYPVDVTAGIADDAWLMLDNGPDPTCTVDTPNGVGQAVGNCGPCGYAHDTMVAAMLGHVLGVDAPTANAIVALYLKYTGGQDVGVNVAQFLLWLFHQGLILGFGPVALDRIVQMVVQLQRGLILGVNLTDQDQTRFDQTPPEPWTTNGGQWTPDMSDGHVVYGPVRANADGSGDLVSWGFAQPYLKDWIAAQSAGGCVEEAWGIVTHEDLKVFGAKGFSTLLATIGRLPKSVPPAQRPGLIAELDALVGDVRHDVVSFIHRLGVDL
ncbi:MAG TPA: hypothetical protein VII76_07050 [Acidimicrobiales bacterium]